MLQRRKRYKNRTILGYKTLALGLINMAEVEPLSITQTLVLNQILVTIQFGTGSGVAKSKREYLSVLKGTA